ncbi:MAG: ornithine carbamoyltransferase [Alphaproteobacteria bacterium]|nr:ornithine carbamoyltransferase [Alphaproteobacteria bacterium]
MSRPRHFLDLDRLETETLRRILDRAEGLRAVDGERPLEGRMLALIFESPSTRTRVSFDVAMRQLGGQTILLRGEETQLGRGETVADTARVLSRYVDAIMIRASRHEILLELAEHAEVPVVNGLTDSSHPCQLMADILTFEQHRGPIAGRTVAWSGDGNNVATSWIHAAVRFGFELRIACPEPLRPARGAIEWARAEGGRVSLVDDPEAAVVGADCVVTDAWLSMRDDPDEDRHNLLAAYQVNERLMALADERAVFMHCLPAHRGEEVSAGVIDGPQSIVWDEAENRLHVQKAILAWCFDT